MKKYIYFILVILFFTSAWAGLSEVVVLYKSGDCRVDLFGKGNWLDAEVGMKLNKHTVIKTGTDGEIELEIDGGKVSIGKYAELSVSSFMDKLSEKNRLRWFSNLAPGLRRGKNSTKKKITQRL